MIVKEDLTTTMQPKSNTKIGIGSPQLKQGKGGSWLTLTILIGLTTIIALLIAVVRFPMFQQRQRHTLETSPKSLVRWKLEPTESKQSHSHHRMMDNDIRLLNDDETDDEDGDNDDIVRISNYNWQQQQQPFVLVTGSSDNHFQSALWTLLNVRRRLENYAQTVAIIFWDFGLTAEQEQQLRTRVPMVIYQKFPFNRYPVWADINNDNRGYYAWKPMAIDETARMLLESPACAGLPKQILWLDGDVILKSTREFLHQLDAQGFFTLQSSGTVSQWVHPGTLQYLGSRPSDMADLPNASGGVCGFNLLRSDIRDLLSDWRRCALKLSCIAPPGSSRDNHRQDQAALTVLMHQRGLQVSPKSTAGIEIHQQPKISFDKVLEELGNY